MNKKTLILFFSLLAAFIVIVTILAICSNLIDWMFFMNNLKYKGVPNGK
ncbi:hypothetical protein [Mycoplasmopsis primatum]|nr:hypothetical protein [Mycoplasmopsis primatum]